MQTARAATASTLRRALFTAGSGPGRCAGGRAVAPCPARPPASSRPQPEPRRRARRPGRRGRTAGPSGNRLHHAAGTVENLDA